MNFRYTEPKENYLNRVIPVGFIVKFKYSYDSFKSQWEIRSARVSKQLFPGYKLDNLILDELWYQLTDINNPRIRYNIPENKICYPDAWKLKFDKNYLQNIKSKYKQLKLV